MFYHVLVETTDKDSKGRNCEYHQLDIEDYDFLLKKIVIPYVESKSFRINGYNINLPIVRRFIVTKSELSTDKIVKIKNEELDRKNRTSGILVLWAYTKEEVSTDQNYTIDITEEILESVKEAMTSIPQNQSLNTEIIHNKKVFIVHGRDDLLRTQVENILGKLGLESIVLQDQANNGKTILEKIEEYTDVGFGIVLYTPCDEGHLYLKPEEKQARARQNVVLEHGYLMGKLGRSKVCCLVADKVEFPSDIQGVGYIPAKDIDSWKYKLVKELQAAGFDVDMNSL